MPDPADHRPTARGTDADRPPRRRQLAHGLAPCDVHPIRDAGTDGIRRLLALLLSSASSVLLPPSVWVARRHREASGLRADGEHRTP